MAVPILEVVNLHKAFDAVRALDGVQFQLEAGAMFGLLGPNGAGKTTLLSILSCLLQPDAGEVRILGQALQFADRAVRRHIGVVPQELALYDQLTARENLHFFGRLYGVRGKELRRRVTATLAAIGLEDRADQRTSTFSGGMKRRLNLGAALVHQPTLLLLDEPTAGVDPQSRNHVFEEVRRLNATGVTIVYTSHYMEEVQALCRQIGIMDHGKVIACDTLPGLLRQLEGWLRIRVPEVTPILRERTKRLPHSRLVESPNSTLELECRDVKATLPLVITTLTDLHIPLLSLEMEEPNLERVFLHLTGRALRD
jgi:ABC-2 type transport system ATP-binding protein